MYYIQDFHIYDTSLEHSEGYYIREILDCASNEYKDSALTPDKKYEIISELGLDKLTKVLEEAFRSNNKTYDASHCAKLTYEILKHKARGFGQ